MRRYSLYRADWQHLRTIKADGIADAIRIANANFPDYRYISLQGRY